MTARPSRSAAGGAAPRAVLTDIEGTTTSLSFVRDELFPLSRDRMPGFVAAHAHDPDVAAWLALVPGGASDKVTSLQRLIDADVKHPALKAIQGRIWRDAYERGELVSHVYDDVPAALRAWRRRGVKLAVYSSGSIEAQRLLFSATEAGDLTPLFDAWFDPTTVGAKTLPASYELIASRLGVAAKDGLFLSDAEKELDAAAAAGWRTTQVLREGVEPGSKHPTADTFVDLLG